MGLVKTFRPLAFAKGHGPEAKDLPSRADWPAGHVVAIHQRVRLASLCLREMHSSIQRAIGVVAGGRA
jgi:hypothetical protein